MRFQEKKVCLITFIPVYKRIRHILSSSVMVTPHQKAESYLASINWIFSCSTTLLSKGSLVVKRLHIKLIQQDGRHHTVKGTTSAGNSFQQKVD